MKNINVSIFGSTGYIGLELIRLLQLHPAFEVQYLYGPHHAGKKLSDIYPHLSGIVDLDFMSLNASEIAEQSDLIFLCLPHGVTHKIMPEVFGKTKIIDLSGDFRHKDSEIYKQYYGETHPCPELIKKFEYMIPEIQNKKSDYIANAGCFASAIQLALFPIKKYIDKISIMAVTGSSGSGKKHTSNTHHPLRSQNIKSYKIGSHQHLPEICQTLDINTEQIQFVPTSGPFVRGIFATCFVDLNKKSELLEIKKIYKNYYQNAPFIRIKNSVQLVDVVGSNFCDISLDKINNQIIIQVCLDNLIKGASGSAIQNANIMFDLPQETGLKILSPVFP